MNVLRVLRCITQKNWGLWLQLQSSPQQKQLTETNFLVWNLWLLVQDIMTAAWLWWRAKLRCMKCRMSYDLAIRSIGFCQAQDHTNSMWIVRGQIGSKKCFNVDLKQRNVSHLQIDPMRPKEVWTMISLQWSRTHPSTCMWSLKWSTSNGWRHIRTPRVL